jgi:hypothetical protein
MSFASLKTNKAPNREERGFEAGYQPDRIDSLREVTGLCLFWPTNLTKSIRFAVIRCAVGRCNSVSSVLGDSPCLNCAWLAGFPKRLIAKLSGSDKKADKSLLTIRWLRTRVLQDREQPTIPLNRGIVGGLFPNRFTILV